MDKERFKKGHIFTFAVVSKDGYDFDTVDGNHLYNGFLDVYAEFKDQLLMKIERGNLDKILWTEKREIIRRKSDND